MSRGTGKMQNAIMDALNGMSGRATTKALMGSMDIDFGNKSRKVSFYHALNGLHDRRIITWYKQHGGINSPSGFICITRKNIHW
jgi:hypothetical protein